MRKIQDKFVPYQQSLDMKDLGFDEPCFAKYYQQDGSDGFIQIGETEIEEVESAGDDITFECEAPLWQDAFEWFREKYGLQHEITRQGTNYWLLTILEIDKVTINGIFNGKKYDLDDYIKNEPKTYEEAELECLKKLIEIVKEK
jgi:hypothetical protein